MASPTGRPQLFKESCQCSEGGFKTSKTFSNLEHRHCQQTKKMTTRHSSIMSNSLSLSLCLLEQKNRKTVFFSSSKRADTDVAVSLMSFLHSLKKLNMCSSSAFFVQNCLFLFSGNGLPQHQTNNGKKYKKTLLLNYTKTLPQKLCWHFSIEETKGSFSGLLPPDSGLKHDNRHFCG